MSKTSAFKICYQPQFILSIWLSFNKTFQIIIIAHITVRVTIHKGNNCPLVFMCFKAQLCEMVTK